MSTSISIFNTILALGICGILLFTILLLLSRFIRAPFISWLSDFVGKNRVIISLALVSSATLISLFYSDVIGYPPCKLCWLQRIFFYSQVVLFATALIKRLPTRDVLMYGFNLSVIGFLIAAYHTFITFTGINPLPCGVDVSCTTRYVMEFGFITIPTMSLIVFTALLAIAKHPRRETL